VSLLEKNFNVCLVQGLKYNVMSVDQFTKKGYKFIFNHNTCTILNKSVGD
jgi:hypothetical protein